MNMRLRDRALQRKHCHGVACVKIFKKALHRGADAIETAPVNGSRYPATTSHRVSSERHPNRSHSRSRSQSKGKCVQMHTNLNVPFVMFGHGITLSVFVFRTTQQQQQQHIICEYINRCITKCSRLRSCCALKGHENILHGSCIYGNRSKVAVAAVHFVNVLYIYTYADKSRAQLSTSCGARHIERERQRGRSAMVSSHLHVTHLYKRVTIS